MSTTLIRDARTRAGLGVREFARRAGVSAPAILRWEQSEAAGAIQITTLTRALELLGMQLTISAQPKAVTATTATFGARIQEELDLGDLEFALRLVPSALESLRTAVEDETLETFLTSPSQGLHDQRMSALLLTAIRWQLATLGITPPAWTDAEPLDEPLYLYPESDLDEEWKAHIRSRTPAEFATRNIWAEPRDFVTA